VNPPTAGGAPPDKKKMFLLAGLGLVIIIVYKQMALSPPTPLPDAQSVNTGAAPGTETAPGQAGTPIVPVKPLSEERIETAGQSWGRDPFIGDDTVAAQNTVTTPVVARPQVNDEAALALTGIAWSKNKAAAIINGQVVREGDLLPVKGKKIYKVLSILKNRVILQDQDKTITLRVRGG
jgi:hypothetical protein